MPQLDTLTYFSQISWLWINFILLYLLIMTIVIPNVGKNLLIRNKMKDIKINEQSTSTLNYESSLDNTLTESKKIIMMNVENDKNWYSLNINKTNKDKLNEFNTKYLFSVSTLHVKQKI